MKYYCLVLLAWCLCSTGASGSFCTFIPYANCSYFCSMPNLGYDRYPDLTNCSLYFDCSVSSTTYAECDSPNPYFDPVGQTCQSDISKCFNSSQTDYTDYCAENPNTNTPLTGYTTLWVNCDGGHTFPALCESYDTTTVCTDNTNNVCEAVP